MNKQLEIGEIIKYAEIKRINERLTKRELAKSFGINYNYYINCTTGLNTASEKTNHMLEEYIKTPTNDVYKRVFKSRSEDNIHVALGIEEDEFDAKTKELINSGTLQTD